MKLLENSGVLLDGVTKTTKHEIKRKEDRLLLMLLGTYFNDRKHVSCKKSHENWGRSHEDIIWILSSVPSFKQYQDY